MITLADYFKLHGAPPPDAPVLHRNAEELLRRVNALLMDMTTSNIVPGIDQVSGNHVASGYRPAGVNAATKNAAVASTHLTCQGIDLQDQIGTRDVARWCLRHPERLAARELWMEDPRWTGGRTNTDPWVHLQSRSPKSGRRVFVPSSQPATAPPLPEQIGKGAQP